MPRRGSAIYCAILPLSAAGDEVGGKTAMAEQAFSTVVRGGTAVLPTGIARVDIGIRGETIAAIGDHLGPGAAEIGRASCRERV